MTRLELITMPALTALQAKELLDQYAEGSLEPTVARDVERLLRTDETLAAEYAAMKQTMSALRALKPPQAPQDLASKVRAALAEEKRDALVEPPAGEDVAHVAPPMFAPGAADVPAFEAVAEEQAPMQARSMMPWAMGAAALMAVPLLVFLGLNPPTANDNTGVHAAGVGASHVAKAELTIPTAMTRDAPQLAALAQSVGLTATGSALEFEGDAASAKRFVLSLRVQAQKLNQDVSGFVPQSGLVRVVLKGSR